MQVSVLDLSLKCKTIASPVQVNVGVLKTLDLHEQSWKWLGCLASPISQPESLAGPDPTPLLAKACAEEKLQYMMCMCTHVCTFMCVGRGMYKPGVRVGVRGQP